LELHFYDYGLTRDSAELPSPNAALQSPAPSPLPPVRMIDLNASPSLTFLTPPSGPSSPLSSRQTGTLSGVTAGAAGGVPPPGGCRSAGVGGGLRLILAPCWTPSSGNSPPASPGPPCLLFYRLQPPAAATFTASGGVAVS
jgi:hypothetical protein